MKLLFLDFETYYSDDFSLKFLSPAEYILSPRFRVNGCAFQEGLSNTPYWVDGDKLDSHLKRYDPSDLMTISHNALFDASILSWRYNFVPKILCCTLSVAQATIRYALTSLSLSAVARHLQLGVKDSSALIGVRGMDLPMIKASGLYNAYVEYALNDVSLCAGIFKTLVVSGAFPMCEIPILDMILRMTVEPVFRLDQTRLALHRNNVLVAKSVALSAIGADAQTVRQNEVFADMLRTQGVDPPKKISPTTGLELYAFAKTDQAFLELEEHPNPIVQALVAARLGAKSTIEETRAQRFINISNLQWPVTVKGNMPMPVRFSGAHTHRGSGDWQLNVQNMTRGGELRKSLTAPPDHKVMVVDSSQIEARLVAFLADQTSLLNQFENGDDVYSNFASIVFNKKINKKVHPDARFCGKTAILGLGFGLGWMKFQRQLRIMSKNQLGKGIELDDAIAAQIVYTYRNVYYQIPALWAKLNTLAIPIIANGGNVMQVGPVVIEKGMVHVPGRLRMYYHNLQYKDGQWEFTFSGKPKRLYGGKLLENIVQYLDRILVFDAAARIQKRIMPLGYHLAQQAHDENGYVIHVRHVEEVKAILMEEMTRRPEWGAGLPLMAEVGVGDNYGEAK